MNRIRRFIEPNNKPNSLDWLAGVGLLLAITGVLALLQVTYAQVSCDDPFYPSSKGATWTYIEPDMVIPTTGVVTISGAGNADFTVSTQEVTFGDRVVDEHDASWSCTAEGLFAPLTDTGIEGYELYGPLVVNKSETGVDIPQPGAWQVGYTWTTTRQLEAGPSENEITAYYDFMDVTKHEIVAKEQITVPAGTFEAFKVDSSSEWTAISPSGSETNGTGRGSRWYVKEIGLVKSVSDSDVTFNEGVESSSRPMTHVTSRHAMELQSYDLGGETDNN